MSEDCHACRENERARSGTDEFAVAEMDSGFVRINPVQYYAGAAFFVAKTCATELHELPREELATFLEEMSLVAQAVHTAFEPRKLNYELLGNSVPHLHWWLTPRHFDDPRPGSPIWENLDFLRAQWAKDASPSGETLEGLRKRLLAALIAVPELNVRPLC